MQAYTGVKLIHVLSRSGAGSRALILTSIQNFTAKNGTSIAAATLNPTSTSNNTFTQTQAQAAPRRIVDIANGSTHGNRGAADDNNDDVEEVVRQTRPTCPKHISKVAYKTYRSKLPLWLSNRVWEINIAQQHNGWDHKLRTYNVVALDSPLFRACLNGDIETVRRLFSFRQASPFDINEYGWTALFVSRQDMRPILYTKSEYSILLKIE